jgi:hypothetical protein
MGMRLRRPLVPLLAALAVAPAAAEAAPPWSAPAPVAGSVDGFPSLAFTATGRGFVAWGQGFGQTNAADAAPGRAFGPARTVADVALGPVRVYGRDRLVAPVQATGRVSRAQVAFGRPGEAFATIRSIGPSVTPAIVRALDANARGDIAALVVAGEGRDARPYLVVRRAGEAFGRPIRLAVDGRTVAGTVALNARGDALAVWERPVRGTTGERDVYARIRTAGGRLGSARNLGSSVTIPTFSAALGDRRRAVVAWLGQRVSEGNALSPATIEVAATAARGPFGPPRRVEVVPVTGTGRYVGQAGVRVAMRPDGAAVVAWTGYTGERFAVRVAPVSQTAVEAPQTVSDPARETVLSDLAVGPSGQAVVAGLQGLRGADPTGPVSVVAAVRPAGAATFGGLEPIVGPGPIVEGVDLAYDPVRGAPVAAWRDITAHAVVTAARTP